MQRGLPRELIGPYGALLVRGGRCTAEFAYYLPSCTAIHRVLYREVLAYTLGEDVVGAHHNIRSLVVEFEYWGVEEGLSFGIGGLYIALH